VSEISLGQQIDDYIEQLFNPADPILVETLKELERAGLPPINVSANEGKLLYLLASMSGAKKILEVGTLAGYSAIWLGRALPADGKLVTLEIDPKHAEVSRRNFERAGLADKIEVRVGPGQETLAKMVEADEGPFDLFFIDADKDGYPAYLEYALKLARPGSVILADNLIRNGKVMEANSSDIYVQAIQNFNRTIATHPRLESLILPIVRNNFDGLSISIVR
jgi:predicted O-methyltransferase YrrM